MLGREIREQLDHHTSLLQVHVERVLRIGLGLGGGGRAHEQGYPEDSVAISGAGA